jgi:riboflavin biosynthesis pyrimidine reductase
MRQIFPQHVDPVDAEAVYADLPEIDGRPGLRLNFVASVDGATQIGGVSGPLSGPADKFVYRLLRSFADIVLVAAGTVRAENYKPAKVQEEYAGSRRRRGQADRPRIAVVSRGLDLDWDAPLFTEAVQRTIVVTTTDAPPEALAAARQRADVIQAGTGMVDLPAVMGAFGTMGARHVLCEGGPSLSGALAAADLLDEVCLTIAPLLASGHAKRILDGPALDAPIPQELRSLLEEDGVLLARYRTRR